MKINIFELAAISFFGLAVIYYLVAIQFINRPRAEAMFMAKLHAIMAVILFLSSIIIGV